LPRWASSATIRGLLLLFAVAGSAPSLFAQTAPPAPAERATPAKSPYLFSGDVAMTLHFIKADKTADFETILGKLREALQAAATPERAEQAASWKIFKATETGPNGSSIYVFLIDPVVKDSDYTVSTILAEGFPKDVQPLYRMLADAYASQNIINLSLVVDLGK
jgi:hypothetical protein